MADYINTRIKKLRKQKGLRQEDLAQKLGIKRSTYAYIETHGSFKSEQLVTIANIFGISTDDLMKKHTYPMFENGNNVFSREILAFEQTPYDYNVSDITAEAITWLDRKLIKKFHDLNITEKEMVFEYIEKIIQSK